MCFNYDIIINAFTTDGDFPPKIKGRTHMKGLVHLQTCRYQDGLVPTTASWLKKTFQATGCSCSTGKSWQSIQMNKAGPRLSWLELAEVG